MYEQQWLHGTDIYFEEWQVPPPAPSHKPGILAHSVVFLTADLELAKGAGKLRGGLCAARLKHGFNILDTSRESTKLEELRVATREKAIGSRCYFTSDGQIWFEAWQTGDVMRFATIDPYEGIYLQNMAALVRSGQRTQAAISAFIEIQNLTRSWIEELAQTAKELGFHGLIGHEMDRFRPSGPTPCKVLFVLSQEILTKPKWITVPK